jgi:hypothetical protein
MGTWHSKVAIWAIVACGILSTSVLLAGQIYLIVQRLSMSGPDRARRDADTVVVVVARYPGASAEGRVYRVPTSQRLGVRYDKPLLAPASMTS